MMQLLKFGCNQLPKSFFRPNGFIISNNQVRHLFSGEELGIQEYIKCRQNNEDTYDYPLIYKEKLRQQLADEKCHIIKYESDLKRFLHLMDNNPVDINTLKDALAIVIHKQNGYKGEKFFFGAVVMRAFHYLNMPAQAVEFFDDEILGKLFTQKIGHQVLLDMLYENQQYGDVLRIHQQLDVAGHLGTSHRRYLDVIVLATYYKLNTHEALKEACALWDKMKSTKTHQYQKSRTFVAALALKQKQPGLALEIVKECSAFMYITVRQIMVLAWTQLGHYDETIEMFRLILKRHKQNGKKDTTSIQVLNDIEEHFKQNASGEEIAEFFVIRKEIESQKLVERKTLDELILAPFLARPDQREYFRRK